MSTVPVALQNGHLFKTSSVQVVPVWKTTSCALQSSVHGPSKRLDRSWTQPAPYVRPVLRARSFPDQPYVDLQQPQLRTPVNVISDSSVPLRSQVTLQTACCPHSCLPGSPRGSTNTANETTVEVVVGLRRFMSECDLQAYSDAAALWCEKMGAAFLDEVLDNREELADALGLSENERTRLLLANKHTQSANRPSTLDACQAPLRKLATQDVTHTDAVRPVVLPRASTSPANVLAPTSRWYESSLTRKDGNCEASQSSSFPVQAVPVQTVPLQSYLLGQSRATTIHLGRGVSRACETSADLPDGVIMRTRTSPTTNVESDAARQRLERAYVPLHAWPTYRRALDKSVGISTAAGSCPPVCEDQPQTVERVGEWQVVPSVKPGKVYYYNTRTGVCQYTVPAGVTASDVRQVIRTAKKAGTQQRIATGQDKVSRNKAMITSSPKEDPLTTAEWLDETTEALPGKIDRRIKHIAQHSYRIYGSPTRGFVEPFLLRQRMPTAEELANPFHEEVAAARAAKAIEGKSLNFEAMRTNFIRQHGQEIRQNLATCFEGPVKIEPAPVSREVQQRFLDGYSSVPAAEIRPTFHGSAAQNYSSICDRGLLIPGRNNDLRVVNGAAHGRGIYTARVDAPSLSRGFCTEPKMLICGVADDAEMLPYGESCGSFDVTAKSNTIKHVGDAVVVFDEKRVTPLFQVSSDSFKAYRSRWSTNKPPTSATLSTWMAGRMPLPGESPLATRAPQTFVNLGKGKTMHVPSGQISFNPPQPTGSLYDMKQKRIFEARRRDQERSALRAQKAFDQQSA